MTAPTTPAQQAKLFEMRRASLLPPDPKADDAYLATLRLVTPGAPGTPVHLRPSRPLTENEAQRVLEGHQVEGGEVIREDVLLARQSARTAQDRAASARRAERAQYEAARLAREAKRFDQ